MRLKPAIANLPAFKPPKMAPARPLVRLGSNENPLGASPLAVAAVREAADQIFRYPDMFATQLRAKLADQAGVTPDMVACSNGSDELILTLSMALLEPGDEVVMAQGTFISYLVRSKMMDATLVQVPLRDFAHDLDAMVEAITPRTRLLFVCNPNNPTGTVVGSAEVRRLLDRVPDDVLIIMDEAYIDFVEHGDYPDLLPDLRDGRRNLLLLRTLAKIHGLAGLRLGYAYAHSDIVQYLERVRPTFNVNALSQAAGLAALSDSEHIERSREHANRSRAFYEHELRALGLEPIPSYTNFIAVHVGNDAELAVALRERGFAITPLTGWGVPGCIRISFGTDEENSAFIDALRAALAERA